MENNDTATAVAPRSTFRLIGSMGPDTLTIIGAFKALDDAEKIVTKEDLRAAIGRDPVGLIHTAIRHMLKDHGTVIEYDRVKGGWRKMTGADNLHGRKAGMAGLRRKARRESEKLCVVDFAALSDPEKIDACAAASIFGAVTHLSTTNGLKRIGGAIQKADSAGLPLGKTLALFHNGEAK